MPRKKISKTDFGERLSHIRLKRGINQIELANAIGITQRAISSYETGDSYPPIPVVAKLVKTLKCSADDLLGVKQTKTPKEKKDPYTTRLWNQFQKILRLPEKDQRAIMRMVNSLTRN